MQINNIEGQLTEKIDWVQSNAFKQGFGARLEEMPQSSNHYLKNSNQYRSFLSGWYSADHEITN